VDLYHREAWQRATLWSIFTRREAKVVPGAYGINRTEKGIVTIKKKRKDIKKPPKTFPRGDKNMDSLL